MNGEPDDCRKCDNSGILIVGAEELMVKVSNDMSYVATDYLDQLKAHSELLKSIVEDDDGDVSERIMEYMKGEFDSADLLGESEG